MTFYRCWPKHWLDAAVRAGLAEDHGEQGYWFGSEDMRAQLEIFAQAIQANKEPERKIEFYELLMIVGVGKITARNIANRLVELGIEVSNIPSPNIGK